MAAAPEHLYMARSEEKDQETPPAEEPLNNYHVFKDLEFVSRTTVDEILESSSLPQENITYLNNYLAAWGAASLVQEQWTREQWEQKRRELAKTYRHIRVSGVKPDPKVSVDLSLETSACTCDSCRVAGGAADCCRYSCCPLQYEMRHSQRPGEQDGKFSGQRGYGGLVCTAVGVGLVLVILFLFALPKLDACADFKRADNCTLHEAIEGGFLKANARLRYLFINVTYSLRAEDGTWLSRDATGYHQCGPSFNIFYEEGYKWLEQQNVVVGAPGNATCYVDPDDTTFVVLDRGTDSLSLPPWFWGLSGVMFAWVGLTVILWCLYPCFHLCHFLGGHSCANDFCSHSSC